MTTEQLAAVIEELAPLDPRFVYLFGSRAAGRARSESDVDLAFQPEAPVEAECVFEVAGRIAARLGMEVDLVNLDPASTVARKEVVRTGRVIQERDMLARRLFEMYTLSDYARLNEERAPVLRARGRASRAPGE